MNKKSEYLSGLKDGLGVCIAYFAVSFTFGLLTVNSGFSAWIATLISGTSLTSAGQFAGINMMVAMAGYFEIVLAVFVVNSRYLLMSFSISQQLEGRYGTIKRLIMSCFVTDEIFAIASTKKNKLTFVYFLGLATMPYFGWVIGTLCGALINGVLPERLQNALGIALYCMFIAIIIPPAKKEKSVVFTIGLATAISCLFYYTPYLNTISIGFRVIIASVISAVASAILFPHVEDNEDEFDYEAAV